MGYSDRRTKTELVEFGNLLRPDLYRPQYWFAPMFLPFPFQGSKVAALADANPRASGGPVQRWLLGIWLRSGSLPISQTKFLRCRYALRSFALWTVPPEVTRRAGCIGCDHAAHQRKEKHH